MSICKNILSLNVRGFRDSHKRQEIFRWLKQHHNGAECIVFLQETHSIEGDAKTWQYEWGSEVIMSHGSANSRGVAILLPSNYAFHIVNSTCSADGRKIVMNIEFNEIEYCLINVYAPTQDMENDQIKFLNELSSAMDSNLDKKILIGGDFNLPLENKDKSNKVQIKSKAQKEINQIIEAYDLVDIWRTQNPESSRYTWRRRKPVLTQSRLDYWLIGADLTYQISKCDIKPSIRTDHSLITLSFAKTVNSKRGIGLWKFNANLVSDIDYVGYMNGIITMHSDSLKDMANKSLKWELIKMEIRNATLKYSKTQASLNKEYENNLVAEYQVLTETIEKQYTDAIEKRLLTVKSELEKYNAIKAEGYRIRAKAHHIEHNEKGSKYFLSLEKRNANIKNITRLKLDNNCEIIDKTEILDELSRFYKKLYTETMYDDSNENTFFTNLIPKIKKNEQLLCDETITKEECAAALKKMKSNKSPGTDGLTAEFYQYFWDNIKSLVYDSITYAMKNKLLSCEQRRGVLRLIPKKGKDLTDVKNWRPISLLNTDYKIIAHVLANRLQKVLPDVISKDQSGYLKGRNISTNIRSIFDIIDYVEKTNSSGLLAFLDFEKAFDKLNWTFLQKALKQFGFGLQFREYVAILYTNIESCIINNGTTSKYFSINSELRQGCPLSALLFVIAVEVLSVTLKNNDLVQGFKIGSSTFKITQLADDTTLFLKNIDSLKEALNMLSLFQNISGLKLNKTKSEILQIGTPLTLNYSLFKMKWEKERIYALGTWFYKDYNKSIEYTYNSRFECLQSQINIWSKRNLTLLGKITVIKTFCISKIIYAITSIEPPEWFVENTKTLLENFLWNSKTVKVKTQVMYNNYDMGGLRLPNLHHFIQSQNVNWIKRLLENQSILPFNYISTFIEMSVDHYLKCNPPTKNLPKKLPIFYKSILSSWFALKQEPSNASDVQREVVWNNRCITVNNKCLFNKVLYEQGLIFVNDIIDNNGSFISHETLVNMFGNNIGFYDYICLKDAIPIKWRQLLRNQNTIDMNPIEEAVFINYNKILKPAKLVKSKEVYWALNTHTIVKPTCITSWFNKYFVDFSDIKWKNTFTLIKTITSNTKLIEFQFKIIHRVYASDSYVSNFDNTVSKTCNLCHVHNNIPHLFVDCIKVKLFWTLFMTWLHGIDNSLPVLSTIDVIFGIPKCSCFVANYCLIHAKWYIHVQKREKQNVTFNNFLLYFENVFIIEKQQAVRKNQLPLFKIKMKGLFNIFDIKS